MTLHLAIEMHGRERDLRCSVLPIKYGFSVIGSGTTPPSGNLDYYGGTAPWVTTSELRETLILETEQCVTDEALQAFSALRLYPEGSVLVAMYGATIGRLGILGVRACVNQAVCVLAGATRFTPKFAFYALLSAREHLVIMASGGGQPNLNAEKVRNFAIPCPSLHHQRGVVSVLDSSLAQIDRLTEAKERQLLRLAEKRRASISHAVTRGLDAGVELVDTGVAWLGRVPRHWTHGRFSRHVFIIEGQVDPEIPPYADMILIAPNHIESATGKLIAQETASEQAAISGKYLCGAADVIYSKIRPALRKVVLSPGACLCSADMYPLRPRPGLSRSFLYYFLLTDQFSAWALLESDRVAMPKVNREALSEVTLPLPPIAEQEMIVAHLGEVLTRLDTLAAATQRSLVLLQERRTALIAAAVSGKLDMEGIGEN